MKAAMATVTGVFLMSACNTGSLGLGTTGVREIGAVEAASCSYVTDIRVRPGVYGPFAQQGLDDARRQVFRAAQQDGANAVVIEPVSPGALVTEINAKAYRC